MTKEEEQMYESNQFFEFLIACGNAHSPAAFKNITQLARLKTYSITPWSQDQKLSYVIHQKLIIKECYVSLIGLATIFSKFVEPVFRALTKEIDDTIERTEPKNKDVSLAFQALPLIGNPAIQAGYINLDEIPIRVMLQYSILERGWILGFDVALTWENDEGEDE